MYEFFIAVCGVLGVIVVLPAALVCAFYLLCLVCGLMIYLIALPFCILDKFTSGSISSCPKSERLPTPKVTENSSKEAE